MGADTMAIKKDERNQMNMTSTVGNTPVWKRRQVVKCSLEPTGFCLSNEYDNHSRKTPARKWETGRLLNVLWTPTGFQPTDHDDDDDDRKSQR